jgi:hypothetical protein
MNNILYLTSLIAFSSIAFASESSYNAAAHEAYYREKAARRSMRMNFKQHYKNTSIYNVLKKTIIRLQKYCFLRRGLKNVNHFHLN